MDTNKDQNVDAREWAKTEKGATGRKNFAALDTHKDGVLTKREVPASQKK